MDIEAMNNKSKKYFYLLGNFFENSEKKFKIDFEIPFHLRYGPQSVSGFQEISFKKDFWVIFSENELKLENDFFSTLEKFD